jgi:sugar transferase (PEP-CTERM/EpsH1 system associated)
MRILFLAHRLPYPPNKGDKIRSFWELKAMSARHDVDLFCFYDDPRDARYVAAARRLCSSCYAEQIAPVGSRMRALGALARGDSFSTAFYYSPSMAQQVRRALRARSYDLIFVFSSSMAQYAEGTGIPVVVDFVDMDGDKWAQYARRVHGPSSWLWAYEARKLAQYEDHIARRFSASILCTEAEARILRERVPGAPVHAMNNFLDAKYFDPQTVEVTDEIRSWQPYLVFTGQMDYYPNVDAAQYVYREVLPLVRAQRPEVKFVIAGRNPARSLRKLASDPAVRVTGTVPDIRPYLRGASAAVMPLRIARGIQNKILEAMAMGLPVATSMAVASALPADFASLLVVEDEPVALAAKLIKLLRNDGETLRQNVRQAVLRNFTTPRLQEQLETIISGAAHKALTETAAGQ